MSLKLKLIGYWHNSNNPTYPDPAWFVDKTWSADERERVIAHLERGVNMPYASAGQSWCRFRCGEKAMGSSELSDGVYVCPEGFVHYIKMHDVKPPEEFVNHVLAYKPIHVNIDVVTPDTLVVDTKWWKQQRGYNHIASTAKYPTDFGVLEIVPETIKPLHKQKIENVLWGFLYPILGYKRTEAAIIDVLASKTVSVTGEFIPFETLRTDCAALGVKVSFKLSE